SKDYNIPGGTPSSPKLAETLPAFASNLRKELKGAPYRAQHNIMCAAVEGSQVPFETASRIESRYLIALMVGQPFKNMTQAFFYALNAITAGGSRPDGFEPTQATKLAVIHAGMMCAGIAHSSADAGSDVDRENVRLEVAATGTTHAEQHATKRVWCKQHDDAIRQYALGRMKTTDDYAE